MTAPVPPRDDGDCAAPADTHPPEDLVGSAAAGPAALRGSALLGGGYAISIGLSLISVPLLIRHLGGVDFGRYTTVLAIVAIVGGLTDAGLANVALREWASRRGEDRAALMRSLLGARLGLSAIGVLAGGLFALVAGYDRTMVLGTLVAGAAMVLTAVSNVLMVSLQGELRFGWVTVVNLVRQAASVLLIVVLVLTGAGLLALLASALLAGLVSLGLAGHLVRRRMPLIPSFRGGQWWPLVRDTLPYGAAIALNTVYFRVTIVAMSLVATGLQTGYFATSFRVTEVLVGVPALAIGAAFPILSRSAYRDQDRFTYAAGRIVELSLVAGAGLALAVALSAPFVIDVLAGPTGAPSAPVLQLQSLALAATFLSMACGFVLLSLRRHRVLLIVNGAALVANVAFTLILVSADQAQGAAIAAWLAETGLALAQLAVLVRAGAIRVPWRSGAAIALAAGAGALMLLMSGLYPLLRMLGGLVIYLGVLAVLGRIPPELREVLHHRHGRRPVGGDQPGRRSTSV